MDAPPAGVLGAVLEHLSHCDSAPVEPPIPFPEPRPIGEEPVEFA
ncbi:MAG TPA: hypothetical protein VGV89_03005 [Thermoplasmata archaeon]|nr:hypothetical protein [Thermoplasmata archaeon]